MVAKKVQDNGDYNKKNLKIIKDALEEALKGCNFEYAKKYCALLENVSYTEAENYYEEIKKAETAYLITLKNEDAADLLISTIDSNPLGKPEIGYESESTPAYDWQAKRHNSIINEYFNRALMQQNEVLAKKLLPLYVEEPVYEKFTKNDKRYNRIISFSDKHKQDATKKFEEAKKFWN